jgi:hypothetical protein
MTPSTFTYLLETLTGLLWIIAGPMMTLAGLILLAIGACDRNKQTALDGLKAFALGLTVCAVFTAWHRYTIGA